MTATDFSVQEFVSIVSHDLRAPIRHLRQFSAMLTESLALATEEQKQFVEFIESSAQQCNQMMDALTELSRLYTQPAELEPIDFAALLKEVCAELAARRGCQPLLQVSSEADQLPVLDAKQAKLLMTALLENAFKFRHKDDDLVLQLHIANVDGQQVMQLTDNGIGIAPNFIDHCTTIFKQLDKSVGGVGKGLALVETIVRLAGGSLTIESGTADSQRGTKVTVALPLET